MMVSVVIATYRRDEELRQALASAAAQTYPDTEIILVDDNADADWNRRVAAIAREFPGRGIFAMPKILARQSPVMWVF